MYAVIMAGGGGTRLWPLSRASRPKPFLPLLLGGRTLLEETVQRLEPLISPDDVYVVTDMRHADMVRSAVPELPAGNILGEPSGRNTAAAVALAAHAIRRDPDDVMVVLPADQAILDAARFRSVLASAAERAAGGDLVTLGVRPTHAETGYGYVIATGTSMEHRGHDTYRVQRFEEKPTVARAEELVAGSAASWNAGIFVWRRDALSECLDSWARDISEPIAAGLAAVATDRGQVAGWPGGSLAAVYEQVRATSIDYALMEPAAADGRVAVVPMDVGWSDLGSWSALRTHLAAGGSSVIASDEGSRVIEVGGRDVLVLASGGRTVAVVGVEDVIVVDTPDALLVTAADAAQDVKQVVDRLRREGQDELL